MNKLIAFGLRAMKLRPQIEQVTREADPIVKAIRQAAPELAPALKVLRLEMERTWEAAKPVRLAIKQQYPTLMPMIRNLWWALLPEIAAEFNRVQEHVVSTRWLQLSLNKLGADPKLVVDDRMGEATLDAVEKFQIEWNKNVKPPDRPLVVDRFPGPRTLSAIQEKLDAQQP